MSKKLTLEDLIRIFGDDFIPKELDKKLIMRNFEVAENRIIGKKTIEKIREILLAAIESTRVEQFKERGKVITSPVARLSPKLSAKMDTQSVEENITNDRYCLDSIEKGIVSNRLKEKDSPKKEIEKNSNEFEVNNSVAEKKLHPKETVMPSIDDLTILSGGQLKRSEEENSYLSSNVQREVTIRDKMIIKEIKNSRWGKEKILDIKSNFQEIDNPAYIFHSDLWQIEKARETNSENRCDILQHVIFDMVANNINVIMLENENQPFFIVEGFGLLYSKDTLKNKVKIHELIQLLVISYDAWQIALKKPETLIKGKDAFNYNNLHSIDMTSVIPLLAIQSKLVEFDNLFKINFKDPEKIVEEMLRELQNHHKNIIWTCGSSIIDNLTEAIKEHNSLTESNEFSLNMVVIGATQAYHPLKIKYDLSGKFSGEELLPGYCKKHRLIGDAVLKNIFEGIPVIYHTVEKESLEMTLPKIAHAIRQKLIYSALEVQFNPGYLKGNPNDTIPISKLDIILPPTVDKLREKLIIKGLKLN